MNHTQTEGIVLKRVPYKDSNYIITVFTQEYGLINVYMKGSKNRSTLHQPYATQLCQAIFILEKRKTSLYRFIDASLCTLHLTLRKSYKHLEIAGTLINTVLSSQMYEHAEPSLYHLLSSCLKYIPLLKCPQIIPILFNIKLLKYSGILHITPHCIKCHSQRKIMTIQEGQSYCKQCQPMPSLNIWINAQDWSLVQTLFSIQKWSLIKTQTFHNQSLDSISKLISLKHIFINS